MAPVADIYLLSCYLSTLRWRGKIEIQLNTNIMENLANSLFAELQILYTNTWYTILGQCILKCDKTMIITKTIRFFENDATK